MQKFLHKNRHFLNYIDFGFYPDFRLTFCP